MRYSSQRAAVIGLGESGRAATRLLRHEGASVVALDSRELSLHEIASYGDDIRVVTGSEAEEIRDDFDLVILSPGVDPRSRIVQNLASQGAELMGELELAFRSCRKPVVAITGTNGKTTVTELVEHVLNYAGVPALACGNIGLAFSEAVLAPAQPAVFAVEVSSFQLEAISTFRPQIAVWLNLTPDHLDRYRDMDEYRAAKLRIFEFQDSNDAAIVNRRDRLPPLRARSMTFSAYVDGSDFSLQDDKICYQGQTVLKQSSTHLPGLHNAENLMAALAVGKELNLEWDELRSALAEYRLSPHRCETVRVLEDRVYINDSKATNLDALQKALESVRSSVVLIAGGKHKGFSFASLAELVGSKVRHAVLIGETAPEIEKAWSYRVNCTQARTLAEAVERARAFAQPGDTILFSPGTSSFDMFKNYADRGNQFRQIVQQLTK